MRVVSNLESRAVESLESRVVEMRVDLQPRVVLMRVVPMGEHRVPCCLRDQREASCAKMYQPLQHPLRH